MALIVAIGSYRLMETVLSPYDAPVRIGIPLLIAAVGVWISFRLVNYARFAEFYL